MADPHVLTALHNKYRQINGELAALDNQEFQGHELQGHNT